MFKSAKAALREKSTKLYLSGFFYLKIKCGALADLIPFFG
tara:strand:+ start:272 stop:391 length:120 start_codon:yes stop_codon:yes gene_type:complete